VPTINVGEVTPSFPQTSKPHPMFSTSDVVPPEKPTDQETSVQHEREQEMPTLTPTVPIVEKPLTDPKKVPVDAPGNAVATPRRPVNKAQLSLLAIVSFILISGWTIIFWEDVAPALDPVLQWIHSNATAFMAAASTAVCVLGISHARVPNTRGTWSILPLSFSFILMAMAPTMGQPPVLYPAHSLPPVWELQAADHNLIDLSSMVDRTCVMMATSSIPPNTHYLWCGDTGANRTIAGDTKDFVPGTLKPADIIITVAKAGITMNATAIGDCELHTFDQHGKPYTLRCKDVLYVPGAAKNLLSLSSLSEQGYQYVHSALNPVFPPGLHLPGSSVQKPRFIPLQVINGLSYFATRNDMYDPNGRMLTRANKYVQWHRNLGFMPMATLRKTKDYVIGLESLRDSYFPGEHHTESVVREGKMHHIDRPQSTGTRGTRPMECIHWDTAGPMKTRSTRNSLYVTVFTCAYSRYTFIYEHSSTADIPRLLDRFDADTSLLQEKHGRIRCVRRDNASVNVSAEVMDWLDKRQIRSETSNPYEPWQNGHAERMIQTLNSIARTVMIDSGLEGRFWFLAMQYATRIHNIQYSAVINSSPFLLMHGAKPDVSGDRQFGVEAWLFVRPEQRSDPKFGKRGEPCIFVGYPLNQQGYLLWCPSRGTNCIIASSNVVFGTRCPRAQLNSGGLFPDTTKELFLDELPTAFRIEEVRNTPDLQFMGTFQDHYILGSASRGELRSLPVSAVLDLFHYTDEQSLAAAHLSLVDSYAILHVKELGPELRPDIPRTSIQALSPPFLSEWKPAMEKEIQGFLRHKCFKPVPAVPCMRTLPGQWLFSRKRTGQAKARFVVGGHRQRLGTDYFEFKNYCAVLASRDNRVLLALAAANGWCIHQTDIEQAFLHGVLDDVDLYIQPPALYPCATNQVLKLLKAVYGLHQAPPKFKKEVTDWLRSQGYQAANDAETVWILRKDGNILIHALYADDFLHFSNNKNMYATFRDQIKKRFDIKTGEVGAYLGNKIVVESGKYTVSMDQSEYIQQILEKFEMGESHAVATPMVSRLSSSHKGEELSSEDKSQYRIIVGSLLYLACWTRPDIAFAVSELSRFVSDPGSVHMQAAKRVLRYLKGTKDLGLKFTRPSDGSLNRLWGYVDSDWAGCVDTRKSTTGYVLMLNGAVIAWKSKRQNVVALSSAEAEFMAASSLVQEVIYIRKLLTNLGFPQGSATEIGEDNRTCIAWSEGSVGGSDRAKHIDLRVHFVHAAVQDKTISLYNIKSEHNVADILTKALPEPTFTVLRKQLMGL
jgi:hypothetical protein